MSLNAPSVHVSQRALQSVVVVLEALELQEVFGPLAALAGGGQVGHLDGGGGAADGRARQVFSGRLVELIQAGVAGVGLHPGGRGEMKHGSHFKPHTPQHLHFSQFVQSLLILQKLRLPEHLREGVTSTPDGRQHYAGPASLPTPVPWRASS